MVSPRRRNEDCLEIWKFAAVAVILIIGLSARASAQNDAALDDYNLAIGLYKQQRWELAADSFRKFVTANPQHDKTANARLYLGLSLVNLEKYSDARTTLRGYVKDYPTSRNIPDAMYRIAECSYLLDDLETAEGEFHAFMKAYPSHDLMEWARPYLGDAQLRINKPEAAAANFQKAIEDHPQGRLTEESKFGLARAYELLNRSQDAGAIYKELAAGQGARAPHAQLKVATRAFDDKAFAAAAEAYAGLVSRFPDSPLVPVARLNAGYALFQLKDYRNAAEQFGAAAEDAEQAPIANYWRGVSLKLAGELEQAATLLKATFEAKPDGPLAEKSLYQWGDAELRRSNYADASRLFVQLVERFPQGELADDSLHYAAEACLLSGDLDAAQKHLAQFDRDYAQSALRLYHEILEGRLLAARGGEQRKQAEAHFQKVLDESKLDRTRALARYHLARTLQLERENGKAVEAIRPLLEQVEKEGPRSEFSDAWVLAGNSYAAIDKFEDAVGAYSKYLEARPDGSEAAPALAGRAVARVQLGQRNEAAADLKELAGKLPKNAIVGRTVYRAAEVAYEKKLWDWSAELFNEVAQAGPDAPQHAAALSGLAWSQFQAGKYRESAATFGNVVEQHPDDATVAPEAAYKQAESLQKAEALEEAAAAYKATFEKLSPAQPAAAGTEQQGEGFYAYRAGLQAARLLRTLGKVEDSDAAYEALLTRFPNLGEKDKLLDEWALLNYEAERFERSDEIFRRLATEVPKSALADDARLSLAESQFMAGKRDEARTAFAALASDDGSDASVKEIALKHLVGLATEDHNWKDVTSAAERFLTSFPQSPHRWEVQFRLGEAQLQSNQLEAAKKTLSELKSHASEPGVEQADWRPRMWILLAEIAVRNKSYDEVAATLDALRAAVPESPMLYQADEILGRSYKNQAKYDEARVAFTRVVEDEHGRRTETAAKSQLMLADTYMLQRKYSEAQREYLKVYHLYKFPEWQAAGLYQAAMCDESLGQWASAVKTYEDLLREFAESEVAPEAKRRLEVARQKAAG